MNTKDVLQVRPMEFKTDNGVDRQERVQLAQQLKQALADSYFLYVKTQGFHWNVVGPLFYSLHKLTESQYEDLAVAIDKLAERIRAIGFTAPGSTSQFRDISQIKEETGTPTAEQMITQLAEDNECCSRTLRAAVTAAEKAKDVKTADLLTTRIGQHEENTWMLRALIS
jgi:starvation-inducible DNA-binding protein